MHTFTLEEAAALIANKYGWHERAHATLVEQLLDAAKDGLLTVRHPHTDLPCRPKQYRAHCEKVSAADLNRYFEGVGAPWRADNDGETADPLFDTEWWNLHQALAWVYLGDRALVKQGALVNEGGAFAIQLKLETTERQGACYPSFSAAEKAIGEALQTGKLTAYGLKNGGGDLTEIPSIQWADLKFWYGCDGPDHAALRDYFRLAATHWHTLRFKRKAILAIWPDPLQPVAMADEEKTPTAAAPWESESHSTLASQYSASLAAKRWGESKQKREADLVEAESVARKRWKNCNDDHARMTHWLQNEYSPDGKALPFADDKLTKQLRKRMATVAREIGKPIKGEKKSPG